MEVIKKSDYIAKDTPADPVLPSMSLSVIEKYRVKASSKIPAPEYLVKIANVNKISRGNISLWKGKAKSKKTFALTMFASTICGGLEFGGKFVANKKAKVLWIDTEQSQSDVHKVVKRVEVLVGNDDNLIMYGLRPETPAKRIEIIELLLKEYGNKIGVLVIDGVRDLVMNINDPVESTEVATMLMKWSYEYNIHISTILHENKSDGSSRGHIGTEIDNKSELVMRVEKDEHDKSISWIEEVYGRGKGFDRFSFMINDQALPEVVEPTMIVSNDDTPF